MSLRSPREIHSYFQKHFNAGDLDALVGMYEPQARLTPQPGQEVQGAAAIRASFQGLLSLNGKMMLQTAYVMEAEGIAMSRGHWRLRGTGQDGKPVEMEGHSVEVMRRQPDGMWKIALDNPFGAA